MATATATTVLTALKKLRFAPLLAVLGAILILVSLVLPVALHPATMHAQTLVQNTVLINEHREFVERRDDGGFVARPVFSTDLHPVMNLSYVIQSLDGEFLPEDKACSLPITDADTVGLNTGGWQVQFEYPDPRCSWQIELDKDLPYVLQLVIREVANQDEGKAFRALIPVYQPNGLWDKVLRAANPLTWLRAVAGWILDGAHGVLCKVLENITSSGASPGTNCAP